MSYGQECKSNSSTLKGNNYIDIRFRLDTKILSPCYAVVRVYHKLLATKKKFLSAIELYDRSGRAAALANVNKDATRRGLVEAAR